MSVIIGRALPDVRDGLKPVPPSHSVHHAADWDSLPTGPTRKCARIVGEVMGKYHPHGNLAFTTHWCACPAAGACVIPLVDGQGNFGIRGWRSAGG